MESLLVSFAYCTSQMESHFKTTPDFSNHQIKMQLPFPYALHTEVKKKKNRVNLNGIKILIFTFIH